MKKRIGAILLLSMLVASPGFAQIVPNDATGARIVGRIAAGGPLYRSAIREAERVAKLSANEAQQRPSQEKRISHPVLLGAVIGAGAGFLIFLPCRTGESVCSPPGKLLMAGLGAGIGAAVGAVLSQ